PQIAKPPIPPVPPVPPAPVAKVAGAGDAVMTTTFRTGDRFTTRYQEGSLIINVTGTVTDGQARPSEIHVQDGAVGNKYDSVDRVPARYRDKVEHLLRVSGGSTTREGKSPR